MYLKHRLVDELSWSTDFSPISTIENSHLLLISPRGGGEVKNVMDWSEMKEMHRSGMSINQISRGMGCDRKTVREYVREDASPNIVQKRGVTSWTRARTTRDFARPPTSGSPPSHTARST